LSALEECRRNGGRIIEINPMPEAGTASFINPQHFSAMIGGGLKLSERHIPVRTSMDVALLKGVMRLLLDRDELKRGSIFDRAFINDKTEGFDALIADLRMVDVTAMAAISGVSIEDIQFLADAIASTDRIIVCWAMGLTQHVHAVANVHQIVNLLLLRGAFGKPGAGACPVRGHSNVQGDRTMGIYEKPAEIFMATLDKRYGFPAPRAAGFDTVEAIEAMRDVRAKVFFALGGNFISATPDSEVTARALMNCDLTVQVSTKLNRSHVITGEEAIILPCLGRSERDMQNGKPQFVTVENSMSVVSRSQGSHEPAAPHLKSEVAIVCGLAAETLKDRSQLPWLEFVKNYDLIRDEIEAVIPGFERFNERVRKPDGFYLPNGPREGDFTTPSGKAQFRVDPTPQWTVKEGEYMMMTIRTHDQFNTTIYGLDDRYRGIHGERRVVLMNKADMKAAGLREKQHVDLVSSYDRERVADDFFVVPYDIAPGCVATYFPEANVLVPLGLKAEKSGTPASKSVVITLRVKDPRSI
ncbi:MAG: FdhF/YdeP family oxidoreductase, partial [Bacteroidota bacterium]|nr:FdhF/YdeP family oxidoreductase [Bacteroidota bacterium]